MKNIVLLILLSSFCRHVTAGTFEWTPHADYSVIFGAKPETSEVARPVEGGIITSQLAACLAGDVAERAESQPVAHTGEVRKDWAYKEGTAWAESLGLTNVQLSFDDSNRNDVRLMVKASKLVHTPTADINMIFDGVLHWGQKTTFTAMILEGRVGYPSREGQRFLSSVRPSK